MPYRFTQEENEGTTAAWVWRAASFHAAVFAAVSDFAQAAPPILIVYGAVLVTESGEVRFFNDVCGLDAVLEKALATRRHS